MLRDNKDPQQPLRRQFVVHRHFLILTLLLGLIVGISLLCSEITLEEAARVRSYNVGHGGGKGNLELASRRPVLNTSVYFCAEHGIKMLQEKKLLKSQSKEDEHLLEWFNGLRGGSYIEMGGLDGVLYSNSYVFNKAFDWKGLMVELDPINYKQLTQNRPNELALVNAAVCDHRQTLHYCGRGSMSKKWRGAMSGVWEFAAPEFRERWWKGVTLNDTTPVECIPLQDIIEENIGETAYFDFFSLDVEGAEMMVLESLDFTKVGFGIIFAETDESNRRKNLALRSFLESNGYIFLEEFQRSYWFVNRDFARIYKHVLHSGMFHLDNQKKN